MSIDRYELSDRIWSAGGWGRVEKRDEERETRDPDVVKKAQSAA